MNLEAGSKLLMIGDSITDCGRNWPVGESPFGGLGNGYVSLVDAALRGVYPEQGVRVVNMGVGGNTVRDLKARWQTDVIALQPDYLTIMIGINDVWRHFDQPMVMESHVDATTYHDTLLELVSSTKAQVKRLFLLSPFYLETNQTDPMRKMTDEYRALMQQVAGEAKVDFVDVQADFDNVMKHLYTSSLSGDRVHPNLTGHGIIARAFLRHIEFDWAHQA
ncbi:SGNH/GDSL hydrolase family protein [Alicyclobacillus fodiniaquatilis]|uniref:SGNH/GDSL hydrolase family protein n=1 Tax=Alicyclobacillus fodiniaquatilis TaxID=1661150 RepID=A0ABW4JC09_9BACL